MAEATLHIRKNDIVRVMVGKEKGKVGRVLKVNRDAGRVIIEKINMVKRHAKPGKTNPGPASVAGMFSRPRRSSFQTRRVTADRGDGKWRDSTISTRKRLFRR
jgi:hypothetical protein